MPEGTRSSTALGRKTQRPGITIGVVKRYYADEDGRPVADVFDPNGAGAWTAVPVSSGVGAAGGGRFSSAPLSDFDDGQEPAQVILAFGGNLKRPHIVGAIAATRALLNNSKTQATDGAEDKNLASSKDIVIAATRDVIFKLTQHGGLTFTRSDNADKLVRFQLGANGIMWIARTVIDPADPRAGDMHADDRAVLTTPLKAYIDELHRWLSALSTVVAAVAPLAGLTWPPPTPPGQEPITTIPPHPSSNPDWIFKSRVLHLSEDAEAF